MQISFAISSLILYIPIWLYSNVGAVHSYLQDIAFTFQSGYIQILQNRQIGRLKDFFTFQSGYIQMLSGRIRINLEYDFTFQSGYIQMFFAILYVSFALSLYIPIWLYSNRAGGHFTALNFSLHSNLVIFK